MREIALRWRHVIVNTKCSWLHGDERGFRSRRHRVHSSGDYRNPPPPHEHEGLREYHRARSSDPVTIRRDIRAIVVQAFVKTLRELGYRVIVVSISGRHLHALVELPDDRPAIRRIIGKCKQRASHVIRDVMPGSIWAEGGEFKPINDDAHYANAFDYIRTKQGPDALVWSILEGENWIDVPAHGARKKNPGLR
jgi:REP element-mobilizing transposase RayT